MSIRDEIARLSAEHDRLMAEHDEWMVRREAAREALMRKSEPEGILYRATEENAPAPATPPEADALGLFGDERDELLASAMGHVIAHERKLHAAAIANLRQELAEMKGRLDTLLATKFAEIIDLPKNFWQRDVA